MTQETKLFAATRWLVKVLTMAMPLFAAFLLIILAFVAVDPSFSDGSTIVERAARRFSDSAKLDVTRTEALAVTVAGLMGTIALLWLLHAILRAVLRVVERAGAGDPFSVENADDLARIAWLNLAGYPLAVLMLAAMYVGSPRYIDTQMGEIFSFFDVFSTAFDLLFILLTFILARVFRRGAEMRAVLEGTV